MIVYFIASRKDIVKNIETLRSFVKIVHEEGHSMALDWVEPIYRNEVKTGKNGIDWPVLYKDSMDSITRADVVIAEMSTQSFGVGYQAAMAIQQKKPTLLLHSDEVDDSVFASGIPADIDDPAEYKKYTTKNIEKIIKEFLRKNDISSKDMRFNFFIDRNIYNYLRWSSAKTGKTKAQILRSLVEKEIRSKDI